MMHTLLERMKLAPAPVFLGLLIAVSGIRYLMPWTPTTTCSAGAAISYGVLVPLGMIAIGAMQVAGVFLADEIVWRRATLAACGFWVWMSIVNITCAPLGFGTVLYPWLVLVGAWAYLRAEL